jgi:hypothetical protein
MGHRWVVLTEVSATQRQPNKAAANSTLPIE